MCKHKAQISQGPSRDRLQKAQAIVDQLSQSSPQIQEEESCARSPRERAAFTAARQAAVKYIGLDRGKSSGKVRAKLLSLAYEPELVDQVVASLIRDDYIDDWRACAKVLRRHSGKKSKGTMYLRQLFQKQGIDSELAEEFLAREVNDAESIKELIEPQALHDYEAKAKLIRRLQSRGYSYNLISTTLKNWEE